ncbi:MAG: tyrosine-type recombinase/integrase [Bryobacteraceae bacterium]
MLFIGRSPYTRAVILIDEARDSTNCFPGLGGVSKKTPTSPQSHYVHTSWSSSNSSRPIAYAPPEPDAAFLETLREYWRWKKPRRWLFPGEPCGEGEYLTDKSVWYACAEAARPAGLKKSVSPHMLRHYAATLGYLHTGDLRAVQELLGHAGPRMTARYAHVVDTAKKNPALAIPVKVAQRLRTREVPMCHG